MLDTQFKEIPPAKAGSVKTVKQREVLICLKKYPTAKITVYNLTAGNMFHKFFCLECEQSYNDLDLDCNSSFDGSLIRLTKKPSMLEEAKDFDTLFNIYTKQVV